MMIKYKYIYEVSPVVMLATQSSLSKTIKRVKGTNTDLVIYGDFGP